MLSLNSDWLIAVFRKAALAAKNMSIKKYERSEQYSKITLKKRDCGGERRPPRSGG